jgi:hypothetical protein
MSLKSSPFRLGADSSSPEAAAPHPDEEITCAIPLQLIARLAAQDPSVQLQIGVPEAAGEGLQIGDEDKVEKIGR